MKNLLIIAVVFGCLTAYGQKVPETCNQLPYAKVDQKAEISNNMNKIVGSEVPETMKKGEYKASYKFYIDCKGSIDKISYSKGSLDADQQKWLTNVLGKSTWKAGIVDDLFVTSLVFVTVTISNGKAEVAIW
jgi:hypothetical protein